MPASGFLISWASMRPSPTTERRPGQVADPVDAQARRCARARSAAPRRRPAARRRRPPRRSDGRTARSRCRARAPAPSSAWARLIRETSAESDGRAALNRPRASRAEALAEQRLGGLVDGDQGAFPVDHHRRLGYQIEGDGLEAIQSPPVRHRTRPALRHAALNSCAMLILRAPSLPLFLGNIVRRRKAWTCGPKS